MATTARDDDNIDASQAPLIEHLAELRTRLIRALLALAIGIAISFVFAREVYNILTAPLCQELLERGKECDLIFTALHEKFFVDLKMSMFAGLFVSFPFIANQLWRFVAPGLYQSEKAAFRPFLIASPVLFALGASLVYFLVMPLAFGFFLDYGSTPQTAGPGPITVESVVAGAVDQTIAETAGPIDRGALEATVTATVAAVMQLLEAGGVELNLARTGDAQIEFLGKVNEYLSLVMTFILAFGLCFQLPVLLTLLGMSGLVDAEQLRTGRKYAVVGIAAAAAILTPPDPFTQIGLGIPVYLLYEISIFLVARVERKRAERETADEY